MSEREQAKSVVQVINIRTWTLRWQILIPNPMLFFLNLAFTNPGRNPILGESYSRRIIVLKNRLPLHVVTVRKTLLKERSSVS